MKHLTNIPNPYTEEGRARTFLPPGKTWDQYLQWVFQYIIGDPAKTNRCSVEELKRMGIVGLYEKNTGKHHES